MAHLDLEYATLACPVLLEDCRLGSVNLEQATAVEVRLVRCRVQAFWGTQLRTRFNVALKWIRCENGAVLLGGHIGGGLDLRGARLTGCDGPVLNADRVIVEQDLLCTDGFAAAGGVWLSGAHIGGQLGMSGAQLTGTTLGPALAADRLTVDQAMSCDGGFTATGEVRLNGAHIGGQLDLGDAHLIPSHEGRALAAESLTVDQTMFCDEEFTAEGDITLRGATINELVWQPVKKPSGSVHLAAAHITRIIDRADMWPDHLALDGLAYDSLAGLNEPDSVSARLAWLRRAAEYEGYRPQAYNRLAAAYRAAGVDDAARDVLLVKQRARTAALPIRRSRSRYVPLRLPDTVQLRVRRACDWFLTYTIGYGYRPGRIVLWLAGALVVATTLFAALHPAQVLPATTEGAQPASNPFLFSLDLLLPVASLGQRDAFVTQDLATWAAAAFTITGWLLGAVLVAGLSGVFKRD